MISGRDIVIFGDDWGRHPSTIQHLARVFARDNRVFWIGSIGHRKPSLSLADVRRAFVKGFRMLVPTASAPDEPNVVRLFPRVIPLHDSAIVRRWNTASIRRAIARATERHGIRRPIFITTTPLTADLIGTVGDAVSCYLCMDDYALFDDAFAALAPLERATITRAAASFFVSDLLLDRYAAIARNAAVIPQGVNAEHFRPPTVAAPTAGRMGRRQAVGFVGLLAEWVDLRLLEEVARAYPALLVLVIGRSVVDTSSLAALANIRLIGEVSYANLPRWMEQFDVGLIPFSVNRLTRASNPLKLLEYLASGLGVVSTDLPEVARFAPLVRIGRSSEEFVRLVGEALGDDDAATREARIAKASEYSWTSLAEKMSSVLESVEARS